MKDKFMTKCSTEFKETAFRKMMPPDAMPIRDVRQETGVTNVTLYKWRNEYRSEGIAVPGDDILHCLVLSYSDPIRSPIMQLSGPWFWFYSIFFAGFPELMIRSRPNHS